MLAKSDGKVRPQSSIRVDYTSPSIADTTEVKRQKCLGSEMSFHTIVPDSDKKNLENNLLRETVNRSNKRTAGILLTHEHSSFPIDSL
jgi:hypothetical protein